MSASAIRPLRDLLRDRGGDLTFADLSEPLLEDLAVGWSDGRPIAVAAAEFLSQLDGIPLERRDRQISGRALLTLLQRQGAPVKPLASAEHVFLLGNPENDEGDPEAEQVWEEREEQYRALTALPAQYSLSDFKVDISSAFQASREGLHEGMQLPPDAVGDGHGLALLYRNLPAGLRGWFHRRYPRDRADALAWKFILAGRALSKYRTLKSPEDSASGGVPDHLMKSVLVIDLGDLARTSILEPV